jgi:adenine-specific DNA-methyltransferase
MTMEKLNPKVDGATPDMVEQNVEQLKALFPEILTEGKIDFDTLREVLGDYTDDREERYSFTWNGKSRARRLAQTPSTGTLRPCPEESVNWDTTQNLFIEGDNLEVLKLLQKSYHKKIKMIYIDPPYNTGNDFIYPDDFRDNIKNYMQLTGQTDKEGRKLSANAETGGRYHTNWLNMMYPRLKLARNLLREDGLIFISIDDVEVSNLRKLCDEVFGEENFVATLIWKSRQIVDSRNKNNASTDHEYVMVYSRSPEDSQLRGKAIDLSKYSNPDNDPRGDWMSNSILGLANASQRPNLHSAIKDPETGWEFDCPSDSGWRYSKNTMAEKIADGRIVFPKSPGGRPREKKFLSELSSRFTGFSSVLGEEVGYTLNGSRELRDLFGGKIFDFPKPKSLLTALCRQGMGREEIVLDFFAGSCTVAHAVLDLNREDGEKRKFIMVQLPEPCDEKSEAYKAGYKTIADIGKERIHRVMKKIKTEQAEKVKEAKGKLQGATDDAPELDLGFKVLKLDTSNIKPWDADFDDVEGALLSAVENIKPDRTEADVLYELLLKYGLDLAVPIEERLIAGKTVYSIGAGALIVCLAKEIGLDTVEGIASLKEELKPEVMRVVFKDSGFANDVVKTNAVQILRQVGIDDVRSL